MNATFRAMMALGLTLFSAPAYAVDPSSNSDLIGRPTVSVDACGVKIDKEHYSGRRVTRLMEANTKCLEVTGDTTVALAGTLDDTQRAITQDKATMAAIASGRPYYGNSVTGVSAVGTTTAPLAALSGDGTGHGGSAYRISRNLEELDDILYPDTDPGDKKPGDAEDKKDGQALSAEELAKIDAQVEAETLTPESAATEQQTALTTQSAAADATAKAVSQTPKGKKPASP